MPPLIPYANLPRILGGGQNKKLIKLDEKAFSYESNIDAIVERFRHRVNDALLNTASYMAHEFKNIIQDTYNIKDTSLVEYAVKLKISPGLEKATIRVINRRFNLVRMPHTPPASHKSPGYTLLNFSKKGVGTIKAFPISFSRTGNKSKIMVTRSGIKRMSEPSWQGRQSAMPFTSNLTLLNTVDLSRETIFTTHERAAPRGHTFIIPRTKTTVEAIMPHLRDMISKIPENMAYDISRERTIFKRKKKKANSKPSADQSPSRVIGLIS